MSYLLSLAGTLPVHVFRGNSIVLSGDRELSHAEAPALGLCVDLDVAMIVVNWNCTTPISLDSLDR